MSTLNGPLRQSPNNPRYFSNNTGEAIYLTGSHVWHRLKDVYKTEPYEPFDYDAYLDLLENHNHNFMRMWTWDYPQHMLEGKLFQSGPHQWIRPRKCLRRQTQI
jgi:hypothetical protein